MLAEQVRQEILAEMDHHRTRQTGGPEALRIVQRHYGWVSDEHLQEAAGLLGMSAAELDGVATFYALIYRRPVGRHVILLCDSVSCWIMGYGSLLDHLRSRLGVDLGGTSADGRFTLLPVACLGCCDHAPAMMIDEDLHWDLTPQKVDEVLAEYE